MPLWGTSADAITNRPKWCPTDENSAYNRGDVYATQSGWVRKAGTAASGNGNTDAQEEVLVAIGGLAGATDSAGLAAPTVVAMRFVGTVSAATGTILVEITYDEGITVVGNPTISIANGNEGTGTGRGPHTVAYITSGSTDNQLRFQATSQTVAENDVLTLGGSNINLAGGTISDTVRGGTAQAASLVLSGLTAVTTTVAA